MSDKTLEIEFFSDTKSTLIEKIVDKLSELDRCLLRKTKPEGVNNEITSARRMSRGSDLYFLPTHLHVIDRLLDLNIQLKREKCSSSALKAANEQISNKNNLSNLSMLTLSATPITPRTVTNDVTVTTLSKQLEESQFKLGKVQEEYSAVRRQLLDVNYNYDTLKDELKHKEQVASERNDTEIIKYKHRIQTLEENLSKHQNRVDKLTFALLSNAEVILHIVHATQNVSVPGFRNFVDSIILEELICDDMKNSADTVYQAVNSFTQAVSEL